jgi:hypothetical protein
MVTRRNEVSTTEAVVLRRAADLLGGARVLRHHLRSAMDVHEVLVSGLPGPP